MIKIIVPYRGRYDYLRITMSTLKESIRGLDARIVLYNTCPVDMEHSLDIFSEIDRLEVKNITCKNIDTILPKVINDAFASADDDYIILLDSDTLVHPKAITQFVSMYNDLPDLGLGTLFNTETHEFSSILKPAQKYGIKRTIGGFGCLIKRSAWDEYGKHIKDGWDVEMSNNIADSPKYNVYCTVNSYLEHIGISGTHARCEIGHPLSIDRASNFFDEHEKKI